MAPEGNQFWKARSTHGRKPIFESNEELFDASCEYFQWVEDHPLQETKLVSFQGISTQETVHLMRAMTIEGLCLYLDIGMQTLADYGKRDDFSGVVTAIKNIIRQQKFEGASAGLLNSNIIARDLGLKDANTSEVSGPDGKPIQTQSAIVSAEMSNEEASNMYKDMIG